MTTLQMFENNNLVPLQISLLLVMHPQFLQKAKNLAILEYLFYMPSGLYPGFYRLFKFPVIIHITDRETEAQGI